jgi:hypothetical protein
MVIIKQTKKFLVGEDTGRKESLHPFCENVNCSPLWKRVGCPQKTKNGLPYESCVPLLGKYLNESKATYKEVTYTPTIYNSQVMESA